MLAGPRGGTVEFPAEGDQTEKLKVLRGPSRCPTTREHAVTRPVRRAAGPAAGLAYTAETTAADSTTRARRPSARHDTRSGAGVPLYTCATGKRLTAPSPRSRCCSEGAAPAVQPHRHEELGHNPARLRVPPDEGVTLKFGRRCRLDDGGPRRLDGILYGEASPSPRRARNARLILDVMLGDSTLSPVHAEVEASRRVLTRWRILCMTHPRSKYRAGEVGPQARDEMHEREEGPGDDHDNICGGTTGTAVGEGAGR